MTTIENSNEQANQVPQDLDDNAIYRDKVHAALKELGSGSAEDVVNKLEEQYPEAPDKLIIARTHQSLTELHVKNHITATDDGGKLIYQAP